MSDEIGDPRYVPNVSLLMSEALFRQHLGQVCL